MFDPAGEPVRREAELGAGPARPGAEIVAAEREEAVERFAILFEPRGVAFERARQPVELRRRGADTCPPRDEVEERLSGPGVLLLRQVADRQRRRRAGDEARVRSLEAGEDPQQRRLA